MTEHTLFAPSERASAEDLKSGYRALTSAANVEQVMNALPEFAGILNRQRQFLLANQQLLDLVGMNELEEILGNRPGEALDCVHAHDHEGGCGCSEDCRYCGAVRAILECLENGVKTAHECRITARIAGGESMFLDLRVTAAPFALDGDDYVILGVANISDEKRKRALERVFFHDVMNTATIMDVLIDNVQDCDDEDELREELSNLDKVSQRLLEEIAAQRDLAAAENGELRLELAEVDTLELLEEVAGNLARHRVAEGKSIRVDSDSARARIVIDARLLRRIVLNMLKNALEASPPGTGIRTGVRGGTGRAEIWVHNQMAMTEEVKHQVFQRSFSTRDPSRGLGTYSMKLLAEQYLRGSVAFESSEASGTIFTAEFHSLTVE